MKISLADFSDQHKRLRTPRGVKESNFHAQLHGDLFPLQEPFRWAQGYIGRGGLFYRMSIDLAGEEVLFEDLSRRFASRLSGAEFNDGETFKQTNDYGEGYIKNKAGINIISVVGYLVRDSHDPKESLPVRQITFGAAGAEKYLFTSQAVFDHDVRFFESIVNLYFASCIGNLKRQYPDMAARFSKREVLHPSFK